MPEYPSLAGTIAVLLVPSFSSLQFTLLQFSSLQFTSLHFTILHHTSLHTIYHYPTGISQFPLFPYVPSVAITYQRTFALPFALPFAFRRQHGCSLLYCIQAWSAEKTSYWHTLYCSCSCQTFYSTVRGGSTSRWIAASLSHSCILTPAAEMIQS
jgi:hypothetical protein